LSTLSLLWPPGKPSEPGPATLDESVLEDLDLGETARVLAGKDERRVRFVARVLSELVSDPLVIAYRQDALDDILADETLRAGLEHVARLLDELLHERGGRQRGAWSVTQIARRVSELEHYVQAATELRTSLEVAELRAASLIALRGYVLELTQTAEFQSLQAELPALRGQLDRVGSITIGVNLSHDFTPESAVVLSLDQGKVEGRASLIGRLFGRGGVQGVSALHEVDIQNAGNALYRDLLKLLEAVVEPVQDVIGRYTRFNAFLLTDLEPELHLLLQAATLVRRLEEVGLPMCRPQIAPAEARLVRLEEGYNVALALKLAESGGRVITNTMTFGGPGLEPSTSRAVKSADNPESEQGQSSEAPRVWVLTGPNRGGKTTFTRAVGQTQVLFQAGLWVPARSAQLSPADRIYTHFAARETTDVGMGRLDEEASRLAQIFHTATRRSVILLNEVLAGTSTVEALGLATDAVRGLRLLGARAIYTTHLHELAARAPEINATTPGDALAGSLVAVVEAPEDEGSGDQPTGGSGHLPEASLAVAAGGEASVVGPRHRRTFHIIPSPPRYVSYASEIAEQHGISYSQLVDLFRSRELPTASGIIGEVMGVRDASSETRD
jgi:DNA mismatch repair protein MutS